MAYLALAIALQINNSDKIMYEYERTSITAASSSVDPEACGAIDMKVDGNNKIVNTININTINKNTIQ